MVLILFISRKRFCIRIFKLYNIFISTLWSYILVTVTLAHFQIQRFKNNSITLNFWAASVLSFTAEISPNSLKSFNSQPAHKKRYAHATAAWSGYYYSGDRLSHVSERKLTILYYFGFFMLSFIYKIFQ